LSILLAPLMPGFGLRPARRGVRPSLTVKVLVGLAALAAGFLVLAIGAKRAIAHGPCGPPARITTHLLHTLGDQIWAQPGWPLAR
jgi:hypothetical protein